MSDRPRDGGGTGSGAGDPSMEDILASIRRILSEDEAAHPMPEAPPAPPPAEPDDVLLLDNAMMVPPDKPQPDKAQPDKAPLDKTQNETVPVPSESAQDRPPEATQGRAHPSLVAPATAEETATSLVNLVRTLAADRGTQVRGGGPTVEDLVREEMRPLLKDWLDRHLPALVERVVRAEIERVISRASL